MQPSNQKPGNPPPNVAEELYKKLTPEQRRLFETIINDPNLTRQVLNSPQAQELRKKYGPKTP